MKLIAIMLIIVLIFSISGCIPAEKPEEKSGETGDSMGVSDIENMEKELNTDELEGLEKDLDIDW